MTCFRVLPVSSSRIVVCSSCRFRTSVGISGKGSRPDDQSAFVRDCNAGLHAEIVRLPGLPFPDALDFRGMSGIDLVLVFRLLRADALSTFQQNRQASEGGRRFRRGRGELTVDLAQGDSQVRALPFDGAPQSLELLGMGIAARLAAQFRLSVAKVCLRLIPANLAGCTSLARAISSSRLSTGGRWPSPGRLSTLIRSNS